MNRKIRKKRSIASNPKTPKEVLIELSEDENWDVRFAVVQNPNTPKEVLIELSKDKEIGVLYYLALSYRAPKEALIILSDSKDPTIINILLQRQDLDPLLRLKLIAI